MRKRTVDELRIIISVLQSVPELHYKSCFEDISGRPEFNCVCPTKKIIFRYQADLDTQLCRLNLSCKKTTIITARKGKDGR